MTGMFLFMCIYVYVSRWGIQQDGRPGDSRTLVPKGSQVQARPCSCTSHYSQATAEEGWCIHRHFVIHSDVHVKVPSTFAYIFFSLQKGNQVCLCTLTILHPHQLKMGLSPVSLVFNEEHVMVYRYRNDLYASTMRSSTTYPVKYSHQSLISWQ